MQTFNINELDNANMQLVADSLSSGKVAVLPSDTIYGLFASVNNPGSIEKIYEIKKRDKSKPFIVHIISVDQIKYFGISIDEKTKKFLNKIWPGPFSVILPSSDKRWEFLHRGTNGLAFRLIEYKPLKKMLELTGPLVGTSVNHESDKPAETIEEAKAYFGDSVDIYLDAGHLPPIPSTVIKIENGNINIIRQGAGVIDS